LEVIKERNVKDMATPVVYFTGLAPETHGDEQLDRLSAVVELFQEKHGYGYSVKIKVWIPVAMFRCRNSSKMQLQKPGNFCRRVSRSWREMTPNQAFSGVMHTA
jgi:hypothetical protein